MTVRVRIIPDDRALNVTLEVRVPLSDLLAVWQALARRTRRARSDRHEVSK
jgi:hypothetical protein